MCHCGPGTLHSCAGIPHISMTTAFWKNTKYCFFPTTIAKVNSWLSLSVPLFPNWFVLKATSQHKANAACWAFLWMIIGAVTCRLHQITDANNSRFVYCFFAFLFIYLSARKSHSHQKHTLCRYQIYPGIQAFWRCVFMNLFTKRTALWKSG